MLLLCENLKVICSSSRKTPEKEGLIRVFLSPEWWICLRLDHFVFFHAIRSSNSVLMRAPVYNSIFLSLDTSSKNCCVAGKNCSKWKRWTYHSPCPNFAVCIKSTGTHPTSFAGKTFLITCPWTPICKKLTSETEFYSMQITLQYKVLSFQVENLFLFIIKAQNFFSIFTEFKERALLSVTVWRTIFSN